MDAKKKSTASGSGLQRASGSGRGEEEQQPAGGTEPKDQETTETTSESRPREPPEEGPGGGRAAEAAATPTPLLSPREEQQLILTVYAEALSGHLTTTIDKATRFLRGLGIRSRQSATEERSPEDFADAFGGKEGVLERLLEAVQMLNALDRSRRSGHNVFDKIRSNLAELCYAVSSSDEDSDEDASEGGVLEQERQPEEKMKALLEERGEVVVETWWERLRKQLKEELDVFRPVLKKAHWELVEVFCEKSTASRSGKQRPSGSGRGEEEQQPAGGADPKDQETTETTSESRPREPPEEGPDGDREAEEVIATLTSKLSPWGKLHLVLVVNLRILEQLLHLVVSKATEFLSRSEVSRLLYSQEEEDDPAGPGAREASSAAGSYYEEMGVVEELLQVVEMLNCMDKPRTQTSIILDKILSCVSNLDLVCHFLFVGSDEDVSKAESVKQERRAEAKSVKQERRAEAESVKQERRAEAESVKQEKRAEAESVKQERRAEEESVMQERRAEAESVMQERRAEAESVMQERRAEAESVKQEKRAEAESVKQEKRAEAESVMQEKRAEAESVKRAEAESVKQERRAEAESVKQERRAEAESVMQERRAEAGSTVQELLLLDIFTLLGGWTQKVLQGIVEGLTNP